MQDLAGQTVRSHYHFSKKLFSVSIKTEKGWRVVRDSEGKQVLYGKLVLDNARFLVSKAGHARCIEQRVKNVHAHVEGRVLDATFNPTPPMVPCGTMIHYNPFVADHFWYTDELSISREVQHVEFLSMGIVDGKAVMLGVGIE